MFYFVTLSYCVLYFGTNIGNALDLKLPMWFEMRRKIAIEPTLFSPIFAPFQTKVHSTSANMVQVRIHMALIPGSHPIQDIVVQLMFVRFLSTTLFVIVWTSMKIVFLVSTQTHLQNRLLLRSCQNKQLANANILLYVSTVAWQKICYPCPIPDLTGWNSDRVELSGGFARMRWHGVILNDSVGCTGPFLVLEARGCMSWCCFQRLQGSFLCIIFTDKFRKAEKPKVADTCFEWHLQ